MKKVEDLSCRMVAFDSQNFDTEILEALSTDRIFAVKQLPEELQLAINNLFLSGDDLFDNIHENSETTDYHNARKYKFGCNNGSRFFINFNKGNDISNETMPLFHNEPLMADAAKKYNSYTDIIITKVAEAIAKKHSIQPAELVNALIGESWIGLTRYYPLTQKRIVQMYNDKVLQIDNQSVLQFVPHLDVTPITLIAYRGEIRGLMGQDPSSKVFKNITVNSNGEPFILVFTGITLKYLTNGWIKPLKHQVVTSAQEQQIEAKRPSNEWRFSLAKFSLCNRLQIEPLPTIDGQRILPPHQPKKDRQYPIEKAQFFAEKMAKNQELSRGVYTSQLPEDLILNYPTEVAEKDLYVAEFGEDCIGSYK